MKKWFLFFWYLFVFWMITSLIDQFILTPENYNKTHLPTAFVYASLLFLYFLWLILGYLKKKISA